MAVRGGEPRGLSPRSRGGSPRSRGGSPRSQGGGRRNSCGGGRREGGLEGPLLLLLRSIGGGLRLGLSRLLLLRGG